MRRQARWLLTALFLLSAAMLLNSCGEPGPVTIGALIPDTGPAASYGRLIRQGIDLAVEDINAKGGVAGGHQLVVEYRDTHTNVTQAKVGLQELVAMKVPAIVGPGTSSVALSLLPDIKREKVVMISPSASSARLTQEGGDWFFRVFPSDIIEGYRMANFCREMYWSRIAIVADNDSFGQGLADIFTNQFEAGLREVVLRENFDSLDDERLRQIVAKVRKLKPDAVYLAAFVDDVARLVKAFGGLDDHPPLLGTSAVTRDIVAKTGDVSEGFVFPQVFFDCGSPDPEICSFVDNYRKRFGGEAPDQFAAYAYDAVGVIAAAMNQAPVISAENVADELSRVEFKGVTGNIQFDRNGDIVRAPSLFAVLAGEVVPFEKFKETKLGQQVFKK